MGANLSHLRTVLKHLDCARRCGNNWLVIVPGTRCDASAGLQCLNHLLLRKRENAGTAVLSSSKREVAALVESERLAAGI